MSIFKNKYSNFLIQISGTPNQQAPKNENQNSMKGGVTHTTIHEYNIWGERNSVYNKHTSIQKINMRYTRIHIIRR